MNVFSLFAGIGGLELGLERAGMTTVGQVEIDPYCQRVLAKHWPDVPRHDDVRTAADWWLSRERPTVDVICGGFPCQDISAAGRQIGISGERSGLWSHMAGTIRRIRPRYVVVENVPRILVRGRDGIVPVEIVAADLAACGYDLWWDCIPAAAVGAPHRRDRWFGIAHTDRGGFTEQPQRDSEPFARLEPSFGHDTVGLHPHVADAHGSGRHGRTWQQWPGRWPQPTHGSWWAAEPDVGRVAHGIPARVDRLKALGNAVVPQVAEHIGRLVMEHAA